MSRTAPETIYGGLLDEIAAVVHGRRALDEFSLQLLKRRADALTKVDVAEGLEIQGYLHFLRDESAKGSELIERAIGLSSHKPSILIRYLKICEFSGHFDRIFEIYSRFGHVVDGNPEATRELMRVLVHNGYLSAADALRSALYRMKVGADDVQYAAGERLLTASAEETKFTDDESSAAVQFVRKYLHGRGVQASKFGVSAIFGDDERDSGLLFEIGVGESPVRTAEIEWDVFSELARQDFPVEASGKLIFALRSCEGE